MLSELAGIEHTIGKRKSGCCVICLTLAEDPKVSVLLMVIPSRHSPEKVYSVSVLQMDVLPPMWQFLPCKGTSQNRGHYDVMLSCCVSGSCCFKGMYCLHSQVSLGSNGPCDT
jgi:hypothetical protein